MNIDEMLKEDVFKNIEPERIEAVLKIIEEVKGKNPTEVMLIIMKYSKVLNSGRKLTKEETDAMMKILYQNLSEEEKEQFKSILKLLEKVN